MRHFIRYALVGMLVFGLSLASPAMAKDVPPDYLTPYNALLQAYVHPGEKEGFHGALVDYNGWAADKNHAKAMEQIKLVKLDKVTGNALTAFWINAYNLLTVDLIVQHQQKETIKNIGDILADPWKTFTWKIDGKDVTLYTIEQEKLPIHHDLRLHLALANGTLSGPDLRSEAYLPDTLDTQLDDQAKRFLNNDAKGLKIRGTVLEVAKLFQRYNLDFETKGGAVAFLRQYHPATPANGVVQGYFDYNWNLNGTW